MSPKRNVETKWRNRDLFRRSEKARKTYFAEFAKIARRNATKQNNTSKFLRHVYVNTKSLFLFSTCLCSCCMSMSILRSSSSINMDMQHEHGLGQAALTWTCSIVMDMQQGHDTQRCTGCITDLNLQHGHEHAACIWTIQHGQRYVIDFTSVIDMYVQHEHGHGHVGLDMGLQHGHGHAAYTGHAAWTLSCSMDTDI
jgi:hypothetical protein